MAGGGSLYDDDEGGGIIADINVTPLVDISLVLLIIFMVTAHIIVSKGIPGVQKPKASTGEEVKTTLELTIDKDHQIFINKQKYDADDAVVGYLKNAYDANHDVQAVITADESVPYGSFVDLVDLVREAGIQKYALSVIDKKRQSQKN
jgi:biopolymer transport protein ExbD